MFYTSVNTHSACYGKGDYAMLDTGKVLMDISVNERLKTIRASLKLSQRDFCKGIYLEQSAYARMEQGKTRVNDRIIELVCTNYHVSKAYLKDGCGGIFADDNPPDIKLRQLNRIFNVLNPLFQDYLIIQAQKLLKIQEGEIQAGNGSFSGTTGPFGNESATD
jgi:transcriptional regulator with XRE-family HTH domain